MNSECWREYSGTEQPIVVWYHGIHLTFKSVYDQQEAFNRQRTEYKKEESSNIVWLEGEPEIVDELKEKIKIRKKKIKNIPWMFSKNQLLDRINDNDAHRWQ